ncbi:serine hydrolase FSH [Geopyxis carbonaria]|nr:serine hydrolase FSH [Geopyxis carbonaria]
MSPPPTAAATAPLKLLFLHGYTQSGPSFSSKTKALQKLLLKSLPPGSTLHFPTAPHKLLPSELPGASPGDGGDSDSDGGEFYGWWRRDDASGAYTGLAETFSLISSLIASDGPFTGIIGFSQGAALAAMLAALLQPGGRDYNPEGWTVPRGSSELKFAACYSGFAAPRELYQGFYEPKIAVPVLHVLGSVDTVVSEERSREVAAACEDGGEGRVVFHPGGHFVPCAKPMVAVLVGFVKSCLEPKVEGDGKGKGKGEGEKGEEVDEFADMPF